MPVKNQSIQAQISTTKAHVLNIFLPWLLTYINTDNKLLTAMTDSFKKEIRYKMKMYPILTASAKSLKVIGPYPFGFPWILAPFRLRVRIEVDILEIHGNPEILNPQ